MEGGVLSFLGGREGGRKSEGAICVVVVVVVVVVKKPKLTGDVGLLLIQHLENLSNHPCN